MYIEKLQLSGMGASAPVSVTFQKGVFTPETAALEGIDVAKILTFFFYGSQVLCGDEYENISGTLHFCENSLHYRINATKEKSALYKITSLKEEQIELEEGMAFGDALFGVSSDVFEATLSFGLFENQRIASAFLELTQGSPSSVGIYDFMNRVRDAANAGAAVDSTSDDQKDLEDTIVVPFDAPITDDPLEATRVMQDGENATDLKNEVIDDLDETIKIAPAPDLEIEALEVRIRRARADIDKTTTELEDISRKTQIGKMSDIAEKIADYKAKKEVYEGALEKKRLYEDTYRAGTIELPDNDYVNELEYAVDEIASCEKELKSIHEERESIDPDHNNNKLSNLYIKVEDDGGIEAIRARLQRLSASKRIYMLSSIFFAIAGAILILAGAVVSLLPIYKNMFIADTMISVAHIGLVVLTSGIMCLIPALTCISRMQTMHEQTLELFVDYGCEGAKNGEEFLKTLELDINESEEKKERLEKLRAVEKKVAACQSRVNEGQRIIREHLTIWDRPFDSRLSYCENAMSAIAVAKEFLSEYEGFKNEAERARIACDEAGYFVMGFEDQLLSSDFDPSLYKMTEDEIAQGEARCEELKVSLNALYDELDALKKERDELVFAEKAQKAQKARPEPDPWLCELIDKLEVIANNENANAWEMAIARAQMIVAKQKAELSETLTAATVILASFETFYDKVMPPQFIRVNGDKEKFVDQIEKLKNEFVSNQIVIY